MTQNTLFMATVEKVLTRVLGDHDPRSAQAKWTSQTTWKPFRLSQSAPNHKEDFQHNFFQVLPFSVLELRRATLHV